MTQEMSERIDVFLENYREPLPEYLSDMKKYAFENHIPIMSDFTADILKYIIKTTSPQKILEIGTAIGYSALFMSEASNNNTKITTVELMEKRYVIAEEYFKKFDNDSSILLIKSDAMEAINELLEKDEKFGVIFLDAAKGQYPSFLPGLISLLEKGGVLVTDNIFHNGAVLDSRYAVSQRDRTIHDRIRQYLEMLKNNDETETITLPIDDGIAITKKVD